MQKKIPVRFHPGIIPWLLFAAAACVFVFLRGQDRNWDLLNYHFYAGYSVLHARHLIDIAAADFQSFFNPMVYAPGYLFFTHLPFPFSAWSIMMLQLLSIPAVILIAREIGKDLGHPRRSLTEWTALLLCVLAPLWWSELGTTFSSSLTAPMILWGLYLILARVNPPLSLKLSLAGSGFLFGFAAGLKPTNAPFAVTAYLALLCLVANQGWREFMRRSFFFIAGGMSGFSVTAGWYWYLWDEWKNPVFPLYNAIFMSPFYNFINFRDMRWHFSGVSDFFLFLFQAAAGTVKTSELLFADARLLIIAVLILSILVFRPAINYGKQTIAFLVFIFSSFILWAVMFAYQRYIIAVELVLGLVIWVLVLGLVKSDRLRIIVMVCLTVLSLSLVRIPDWRHADADFGDKNPFSIEMEDRISDSPAVYLVAKGSPPVPVSFILPFLHPDSRFYGIEFHGNVDERIRGNLADAPPRLPLRIIAPYGDAPAFNDRLESFGYDPKTGDLECGVIQTGIGPYLACETDVFTDRGDTDPCIAEIDFSAEYLSESKGILWDRGLSSREPWGRWSDSDIVEFGLSRCLPRGPLELILSGHAFGPNIGRRATIRIGARERTVVLDASTQEVSVRFVNHDPCARKLTIQIPEPASPLALGMSSDPRPLGIGFVRMKLLKKG